VAVNAPDGATCVDGKELVDALARARVAASLSPTAAVTVKIEGTPGALSVTLLRNRVDATELLPPATCDTATDAVAAFLASALAPADTNTGATPRPAPPAHTLAPNAPNPWAERERTLALGVALDRVPGRGTAWVKPSLEIFSGSALVTLGAFEVGNKTTARDAALVFTGGGIELAGGIGALVAGRDYAGDAMFASLLAGEGLLLTSLPFYTTTYEKGAVGAGFMAAAVLASVNLFRHRPLRRLHAMRDELSSEPLTRARAAEIERELARADPLVPYWLVLTPAAAGFAAASVPAVEHAKKHDDVFIFDLAMFAGLGAAVGIEAARGSIRGGYERALEKAGLAQLSLGPGPAPLGVSLVGRF